jgi:hypothetical protein
MSFDINPLGTQMHLRQIEREVRHLQRFEGNAADNASRTKSDPTVTKGWIARIAEMFLAPRHAG